MLLKKSPVLRKSKKSCEKGERKITQSDSGLKILYVSNAKMPEQFDDNLFLINEIETRYERIMPASIGLDSCQYESLDPIHNRDENQSLLTDQSLIFSDYYGDHSGNIFSRVILFFVRPVSIHRLINVFYIVLNLLKLTSFDGRINKCFQRLKLIMMGALDARVKGAADCLVSSDIALVLMPHSTSAAQRFFMLASALRSRIPVLFLSAQTSPHENLVNLTQHAEPAAHDALRRRRSHDVVSISDIYGANTVVAEYCGLRREEADIPGFWMHGWIPSYHNVHPAFIALHKREISGTRFPWSRDTFNTSDVQLVARADQENFLCKHGYTNVKAIGSPFVYLKQPDFPRIKDSLLVVPPHGIGWRGENSPLVKKYVEYISSLKTKFSVIRLCIPVNDYITGDWWPAFQKAGIENIVSVDRSDPRAMHRLRQILSQFEYVTTNCFGSIIAYAAYSGCKISVAGPYDTITEELLKKSHAVIHFPELLEKQIQRCSENALRSHYPELFIEPEHACERISWGSFELGYKHRLSIAQMHTLLKQGWREGSPY